MEGTVFTCRAGEEVSGKVEVQFFVEGEKVGSIKVDALFFGSNLQFIDMGLQKWVTDGVYRKTVKDRALLSVLKVAQRERKKKVVWYKRTWRFLFVETSDRQDPQFVLTQDKSDIPDRYQSA